MKNKAKIILLVIFLSISILFVSTVYAQEFSLKFTVGYGNISIGDYNTFGEGLEIYFNDLKDVFGGETIGEFERLNLGFEYSGEVMLKISKVFNIGVGVDYIQRSSKSEFAIHTAFMEYHSYTIEPYFRAIPIKASVYYFIPIIKPLKLFLNAGVGYYFGKMTNTTRIETLNSWSETKFDVKDRAVGFHGGVGLEIEFIPRLILFLEGKARYCILKSWEGEETYQDSDGFSDLRRGTLFFYQMKHDPDTGNLYPTISMDVVPIGIYPKYFAFDLSEFSLRAGIRIRF
ncbi:outer membrane beta-barrel protein [bacterium]|nr:outer membrane beta-barrel protein [bacterium]